VRTFLKCAAIGALLGIFLFPAFASAQKFKISARSEYWILTYLEGKFDKKYGLEADPIRFGTGVEVAEAILGGTVQFASSGHIPLTSLLSKTKNVLVVGSNITNNGSIYKLIVKKNSKAKTLADLKGKRIATKIGSGSYVAFNRLIKAKGFKEKDFEILNSRPPEIIAAMQTGSVEGGIWFPPTTSIILWKGFGRVLLNFDGNARAQGHWLVNRKYAEKNPDVVVRFLAGAIDAQELLANNPRVAAILLSRALAKRGRKLPPEVFTIGLGDFDFSPVSGPRHLAELKIAFNSLKARGRIKGAEPNWSSVIRHDFMQKALKLSRKRNKRF
jgi:ABC-type nitrate/sulfonate/bicarbonate transport system substrate-binding protein